MPDGSRDVFPEWIDKYEKELHAESYKYADPKERELREKIKEVLRANDIDSDKDLSEVMEAVKALGVKTTNHFQQLEEQELRAQGIPLVTVRILMKAFGSSASYAKDKLGDADQSKEGASDGPKDESTMERILKIFLKIAGNPMVQHLVIMLLQVLFLRMANSGKGDAQVYERLREELFSRYQKTGPSSD